MSQDSAPPAWPVSDDTLTAFASRLDHPVCVKDLDCRYRYANDAALRAVDLFGGAPVIGERLSTLCPSPDAARIEQHDQSVMESGATCMLEEAFVAAGHSRRYLVTRVALRDAGGRVCGLACLGVERRASASAPGHPERGDREHLLAAERDARERAERALQARDRFLAVLAHDLRSPLNGIQVWANVLEKQLPAELPPLMRRALDGIRNGIDHQVRLIEDLLDATRIMSGGLSLSVSTQALGPLVQAAVENVAEAAALRGVEIRLDLGGHAGETVRGDPHRLQQIVRKLLSNAIEFSPPQAAVDAVLERDGGTLKLSVRDQGPGVDPAVLPRLFEWFGQEQPPGARHHDGMVTGLALVRRLAELHAGQLGASSAGAGADAGASFELRLPLALPMVDGLVAESPATALPAGLQVLVIDDQPESCAKLRPLLAAMQMHPQIVATPDEALAGLEARGGRGFDVLLCDLDMPVQGVDQLPLRLRALEDRLGIASAQRLPVIAFTAFGESTSERLRKAGFSALVRKPASAQEIAHTVARTVGRRHA